MALEINRTPHVEGEAADKLLAQLKENERNKGSIDFSKEIEKYKVFMKKILFVLLLLLAGCQNELNENPISQAHYQFDDAGIALQYTPSVNITTTSSDPILQRMVQGFPATTCQWQELYFIGYNVVRVDKTVSDIDLEMQDWNDINNQLITQFYKVVKTQVLVDPSKAIDPTASLKNGWTFAGVVVLNGTQKIGVAHHEIPNSSYYQISFVKFTKWK